MNKTRTVTLLALSALIVVSSTQLASAGGFEVRRPADYVTASPERIALWNETENAQPIEVLDWTIDRFGEIGIELPASDVIFHSFETDLENCHGRGGYHVYGDGEHTIDVCAIGVPSRRHLLLHEFAHAWAIHHLDQDARETFMEMRGLDGWREEGLDWAEMGTEHAAEIIAWGLGVKCNPQNMLEGEDYETLAEGFEFLTGSAPVCEDRG